IIRMRTVVPARAGVDLLDIDIGEDGVCGPCASGGGPWTWWMMAVLVLWPPRERGWTAQRPCYRRLKIGSPAHLVNRDLRSGVRRGELSFVLAVRDVFSATSCSSGAGAGLHGPWCAWDHDPPACEAKARSVPRLRRADGPDP